MINLVFQQSYLSITRLPTVTLPDFTLITGPNGAGKSHLLEAIRLGSVKTDVAPQQSVNDQTHVRLFNWSTLVPQDTNLFSSETIRQERQGAYTTFVNLRRDQGWLEPARDVARRYNVEEKYLNDPGSILLLSKPQIADILKDELIVDNFIEEISNRLKDFDSNIVRSMDPNSRDRIKFASISSGKPISSLAEEDILSIKLPSWGQSDLFQQSFARLFVAYRDLLLANDFAEFRASKGKDERFLTADQFEMQYGPAPWDFVNKSIREAGLDFKISSPPLDDYTQFKPILTKISNGIPIDFNYLSSGEKILMSFAFCVYYSTDKRQIAVHPKLLLLDEIDAPLHPSMSKNIVDTITKTLVGSFGIKVIATTHSPSTVALTEEESIYTMIPGQPGLHKTSKATALNILTVGVPTIAISYDGRRQIFVESPVDARIYDGLYKLIKPKIASERSLEFIATGTRRADGKDINTGCDNVKRIVEDLRNAGNMSVFGLLDWDGKRNPTDRLAILAHGVRNGIENVLFDPLLIALTICRSFVDQQEKIGIPANLGYLDIALYDENKFQKVVNIVGEMVFGNAAESTIFSLYIGGMSLEIDKRFGDTDDHELEKMILKSFPFLRSIAKQGQDGKLLDHIVTVVLSDVRFMPIEVRDVMIDLLERVTHS